LEVVVLEVRLPKFVAEVSFNDILFNRFRERAILFPDALYEFEYVRRRQRLKINS